VLEALACRREVSSAHLSEAGIREIRGLGRTQRGRTLERSDGLLDVVGHEQRDAELMERVGVLRPELEHARERGEGRLRVAAMTREQAKAEARLP
jgi:hypothetical protein